MDFLNFSQSPFLLALAIVLGMSAEASVTLFFTVFLVGSGQLNPLLAVALVFLGAVIEQQIWFFVGGHLTRFKKVLHFSDKLVGRFDQHFLDKPARVMLLSKFVYGLHRTVLIRFGMLNFSKKKYFQIGLRAILIWFFIFAPIVWVLSASYETLKIYVKYGELLLLGFVVVFFSLNYLISKKLGKKV